MNAAPILVDFDDPDFDPFLSDDVVFGDLEDTNERLVPLRDAAPVHRGQLLELLGQRGDPNLAGKPVFTVMSYAAVQRVLSDPVGFSNDAEADSIGRTFGTSLTVMNAPQHPVYRRIFQRIFFPNQVAQWSSGFIAPVINGLIDRFADDGRSDLVETFTRHFPFGIIYRQLALPERDIVTFRRLAASLTMTWGGFINYGIEASGKLGRYLASLVEQRRREPGNDLVSLLATTEQDGERLPDDVVVSFLRQLLNAAGDTTYRATGTLLTALLSSPEQFEAVKADRELLPIAIDEALRWDGPVLFFRREATRTVAVEGVELPEGAVVEVATGAANRDPKVYRDPARYDIRRERVRHFAFGSGPHVCLGQHLARLEMTHAIGALLDRFPTLRLDPSHPKPVVKGVAIRAPRHVHVRFD
jgi:cytochrome P450